MVCLDPDALRARDVTPSDVLKAKSLTLPSRDAEMGDRQFVVRLTAMPPTLQAPNHVPIKQVGPTTVYLSDVAHVADAWAAQQNIVHAKGKRWFCRKSSPETAAVYDRRQRVRQGGG
jgi:multidrug efflux pump subunit AcrB